VNKSDSKKAARGQWKHVDGGMAFVVPVTLLRHPNWIRAGAHAIKLVLDLGRQYTGFNNGYLCAAWELMKDQGWRSKETLLVAIAEAEHYRLIFKTQQGGKNKPNLYALTWWQIHRFADRPLDANPTAAPSNAWKEDRPPFMIPEWLVEKRARDRQRAAQKRQKPSTLSVRHAA
jgi:hypothetical protein